VPDEKFVKRPQRGEAELCRRTTQIIPAKKTDEAAEVMRCNFSQTGGNLRSSTCQRENSVNACL